MRRPLAAEARNRTWRSKASLRADDDYGRRKGRRREGGRKIWGIEVMESSQVMRSSNPEEARQDSCPFGLYERGYPGMRIKTT